MGIYTRVQFEYLKGSDPSELEQRAVSLLVKAITDRFTHPDNYQQTERVVVFMGGPDRDGVNHWPVRVEGADGRVQIHIGALLRAGSETVEFHS